ncbi:MAG: hypothetical protein PHQ43_14485 [Dehalococcoidales bacterium]|nr:hypothetical protein [Dehalococcoidales bacterium]
MEILVTISGVIKADADDLKRLEAESPADLVRAMALQGVNINKKIEPVKKGK